MAIEKIFLGTTTGDKTGDGAREAGQKINNNFEYLETKIDNQNIILVNAGYFLSGNSITFKAGWQWKINNVDYTNPVDVILTIPYAAAGKQRIDVFILNTSNTFTKITGTEVTSNPVTTSFPYTIKVAEFLVTDTSIRDSASLIPFLGSIIPTSTPTGTGAASWNATQAGTYTNFGSVVVNANSLAVISRNEAGAFSISQTALDLTTYAKISDVQNSLTSTETTKPLSAYQGKLLSEKIESSTQISYTAPLAFRLYTGTATYVESSASISQTDGGGTNTMSKTAGVASEVMYYKTNFIIPISGTIQLPIVGNSVTSGTRYVNMGIGCIDASGLATGYLYNISSGIFYKSTPYGSTIIATFPTAVLGDVIRFELIIDTTQTLNIYKNEALIGSRVLSSLLSNELTICQKDNCSITATKPILKSNVYAKKTELATLDSDINASIYSLPIKTYNFKKFNTANIVAQSTGTIGSAYTINNEGLDINYTSSSSQGIWYSNLGIDNTKQKYEIYTYFKITNSTTSNSIIGFSFGTYGSNLFSFGYKTDGSLFTHINGVFTVLRGVDASLSFTAGDSIGLNFYVDKLNSQVIVKTVKNGIVDTISYIITVTDFTNNYVYLRYAARLTFSTILNLIDTVKTSGTITSIFYVSDASGSDANSGSKEMPFKTISKGLLSCVGKIKGKVIVAGGVYREQLNYSQFSDETIELLAQTPDRVQILGSNKINSFTKTAGQTNVYESAFSETIIIQSRTGAIIYENGRNSKLINASEKSAYQRGLLYRLPFSVLINVTSIALVNTTAGSYFVNGGVIYIHTNDSNNPNTNGFTYENIIRFGLSTPAFTSDKKANLILKNIQFLYTKGVEFSSFNKVERYMCTSLASSGDGAFIDNNNFTIGYKDETGYCTNDGINGHYNSVPNYITKDEREGVMNGLYIEPWCHDNFDDGLSFHERSDITIQGGLFEYNGDGGVRQSGDALMRISNAIARRNGWDVAEGTSGSGFDCVGTKSAGRDIGKLILNNCESENNRIGIGVIFGDALLSAFNCVTRNNSVAEYYAESGALNATNCKATNSDSLKLKVQTGGIINVINDSNLI